MKSKNLIIVFVALLVVYLGITFLGDNKEGNFDNIITNFNTKNIDKLIITPKEDTRKSIELVKKNGGWTLIAGGNEYQADDSNVQNAISSLDNIKTNNIVTKNAEKWSKYEVEDGKCKRVQAFEGSNKVMDLLIGKFKFDPQTRTANSYVRFYGKNKVYSTDGFSGFNVPDNPGTYRIKTIARFAPSELKSIKLTTGGRDKEFINKDGTWFVDEIAVDSIKMVNYINGLSGMESSKFVQTDVQTSDFSDALTLQLDNEEISIKAYPDTINTKAFAIHSSANEKAYFDSDSTGIYKRIFSTLKEISEMQ